jgi:hypothetical protein
MSFDVYAAIQEHAPNDSATSAGDLHEEIWADLLRRADPRVHNVRVTRGDGGLDGVAFLDPATGQARVYQAKFFKDLKDATATPKAGQAKNGAKKKKAKKKAAAPTGHRGDVIDAFVRAHGHSFVCTSWVLLLPSALSHTDLSWLMGGLKPDALAEAAKRKGLPADTARRIAACAIEYKDRQGLNDLLAGYLDVAANHLPRSSLSLAKELSDERAARDKDREDVAEILRNLREESIRSHQAETRRAKAALSILNQGWANLTGMLQLAMVNNKLAGKTLEEIAVQVEQHAANRAAHAYSAEGLAPGVSELVSEILYQARVLQQVSIVKAVGMADADSEESIAKRIIDSVGDLQRRVGAVSILLAR